MREHQITITLQAEQFQEIQRLARSTGARSVGTFARDKLLATLGLTMGNSNRHAPRVQDLTSVTGELRRLHRELQIFIAESLSTKDYGYVVSSSQSPSTTSDTTDTDSTTVAIQNISSAAPAHKGAHSEIVPVPPDNLQEYSQSAREAEDLAERAFVISPRLGAIEEANDDPMDFSDPLDELLRDIDPDDLNRITDYLLEGHAEQSSDFASSPIENNQYSEQSHIQNLDSSINDPDLLHDPTMLLTGEDPHSKPLNDLTETQELQPTSSEAIDENSINSSSNEQNREQIQDQQIAANEENSPQTGIQAEESDVDFQNRPPLSGGPPPRKRRT